MKVRQIKRSTQPEGKSISGTGRLAQRATRAGRLTIPKMFTEIQEFPW